MGSPSDKMSDHVVTDGTYEGEPFFEVDVLTIRLFIKMFLLSANRFHLTFHLLCSFLRQLPAVSKDSIFCFTFRILVFKGHTSSFPYFYDELQHTEHVFSGKEIKFMRNIERLPIER